jgi:hypothetical protein
LGRASSDYQHKLYTLVRVLRHVEVMDTLSRCAALRAACGAPAPSSGGEVNRLWDVSHVSFSAAAVHEMMRKQATGKQVPYASRNVAHHAREAHLEVWQQLLRIGSPELAVLMSRFWTW